MLKTHNIKYNYPNNPSMVFPDIDCQKGEQWLLLGQSGSGKTTLLHLLGGLLSPKSGDIVIDNTNIAQLKGAKLDKFRGQHIGIIFQTPHFVEALTVEENLILAQQLAGLPIDKSIIYKYLEKLNLSHKLNAKTQELSIGEAQRVAIARALINKPALILADEPTSALDDANTSEVITLLENQAAEAGATLLIVTHDGRLKQYFTNQIVLN